MPKSKNITPLLISLCLFGLLGLACGEARDDDTPPYSPNSSHDSSNMTPDEPTQRITEIAGNYNVSGTNVEGLGQYSGSLKVTKRDDVYQFSWTSGNRSYDGVGVKTGENVAVSYTEGSDGKGCGVVLYHISDNGDLNGTAGYWGVNKGETETAKRTEGTDLAGKYDITGTSPDGNRYSGTLVVEKDGDGYTFKWNAGNSFSGYGIRIGDYAAIGLGGKQCGFVMYEAKADGSLEGKWGGQGTKRFGTETAKRK